VFGQPLSQRAQRLLLFLVSLTAAAALAAAFVLLRAGPSTPPTPRADESDIADYVGNEACRPCHAAEYAQYQASSHAHTLRRMSRAELGDQTPPTGRINGSQYALLEQDDQFYFEVNPPGMPDKYQLWPLDYVFGSGKSGLSFVSMLEGRNVVEMKMSYFPRERVWRVTPGQKLDNPAAAGNLGNLDQSRRCLGCHVIAMSRNTFVPRREFFGVGCESCHGPGRAHIAAVQVHASDLKMARLAQIGARELNTLCGKCHQTEKDVASSPVLAKMTYRFQPYGLMLSRCFRESGNRLSCLTCHSAHADISIGPASYTGACLSCHSPDSVPPPNGGKSGKVCPVNAKSDCTTCHMPKRDMQFGPHNSTGIFLTEHRIGIYPAADKRVSSVVPPTQPSFRP